MKTIIPNCVVSNYTTYKYMPNLNNSFQIIAIDTWYDAFTTPNNPPISVPPAYMAIRITENDINAHRFKRGMDGYIANRFVRQVSCKHMCMHIVIYIFSFV